MSRTKNRFLTYILYVWLCLLALPVGAQQGCLFQGFPAGAGMRQRLYKGLRGVVNLADKTHLFGDLPEKGREALVQRFGSADYKVLDPQMRKTFVKVISQDLTEYLPRIKAPTLLYWGAQDTETPLWMAEVMKEKIPDAGLVVEQGAGHFAYLEHSATFLRILDSFLLEGRA